MSELNSQVMSVNKNLKGKSFQVAVSPQPKRLDVEFIGKPAKLLNHDEVLEWFEGERELWQENY